MGKTTPGTSHLIAEICGETSEPGPFDLVLMCMHGKFCVSFVFPNDSGDTRHACD